MKKLLAAFLIITWLFPITSFATDKNQGIHNPENIIIKNGQEIKLLGSSAFKFTIIDVQTGDKAYQSLIASNQFQRLSFEAKAISAQDYISPLEFYNVYVLEVEFLTDNPVFYPQRFKLFTNDTEIVDSYAFKYPKDEVIKAGTVEYLYFVHKGRTTTAEYIGFEELGGIAKTETGLVKRVEPFFYLLPIEPIK